MHPISFQFKRAHLTAVAFGKRVFRGTKKPTDPDYDGVLDMTPARFDILFLIQGQRRAWLGGPGSIAMSEIQRRLGLSRATISKAIRRLVELGLVTKESFDGRRGKVVSLTEEGLKRMRLAFDVVFRKAALARHIGRYFARAAPREKRRSWIDQQLHDTWWLIHLLAGHLGDRSEPIYLFRRGLRWNDAV